MVTRAGEPTPKRLRRQSPAARAGERPCYDALVVVMGDDALDEVDDELVPLTPDPLDPWPKKPPLLVLVLVLEEEVVPDVVEEDAALAPSAGRWVATSPPNTPNATMALTTMPCFSRWTSRSESALERRGEADVGRACAGRSPNAPTGGVGRMMGTL